jgi:hypothetical protein
VIARADFTGQATGDGFGHGIAHRGHHRRLGRQRLVHGVASGVNSVCACWTRGLRLRQRRDPRSDQNKRRLGIGSSTLLGHPRRVARTDPFTRAVERAWGAGLLVVVSAGNRGRDGYATINVPGNDPRVLTVGAMNDLNTITRTDDVMGTFSSRGPSRGDLVMKPDVVAPGNRIVSALAPGCKLATMFPERVVGSDRLELSGTSMAAAVVSGAAALAIQRKPVTGPDQGRPHGLGAEAGRRRRVRDRCRLCERRGRGGVDHSGRAVQGERLLAAGPADAGRLPAGVERDRASAARLG